MLNSFVTRVWEGGMVEANKSCNHTTNEYFTLLSYVPCMHTVIFFFLYVSLVHVGCFQSLFAIVGFSLVLMLIGCQLVGTLGGSNQSTILLVILLQQYALKATT